MIAALLINASTVAVLILLAAALVFALYRIVRKKKTGGCGCGCSGCDKCKNRKK
ncbi:MAG: FeoB-associated Cys-rich membrane protein [Eubacteriales bacterium]